MSNIKRDRRSFLGLLPYALAGGFSYPLGKFLFFDENPNKKVALPLKKIGKGITYLKNSQLFIYKQNEKILVYSAHCTHMGCILNFDKEQQQFNCPCHKSRFNIDGRKLRGPAKRDLDRVSFKIKNKTLYTTGVKQS